MFSSMSPLVSKLNINGQVLYTVIEWKENENDLFYIKVFEKENNITWSGRFSNSFAERFRENVSESPEEYKESVKSALSGNHHSYEYEFNHGEGDTPYTTLKWKKRYPFKLSNILRQHGAIALHKDNIPEPKDTLIDILLSEHNGLQKQVMDLEVNNELLASEREQSTKELEKFVNVKASLEMSLYSKFIKVLESKKRRIEVLEENFKIVGGSDNKN